MEAGAPERPLPPLPRPLPDMLIFVDEIPYVCVQRYTLSEATKNFLKIMFASHRSMKMRVVCTLEFVPRLDIGGERR
jgi:hypothetical protein